MNNSNGKTVKDDSRAWELAGFTGEEGNLTLIAEWSRINLLIPPKVDLDYLEGKPIVRYPVSDGWVRTAKRQIDLKTLMMKGWKTRVDNDNLLDEFMKLGRLGDTSDAAGIVAAFAKRWGPLWTCAGRGYDHLDCHWSLQGAMRDHDPCGWAPYEFVEEFIAKGRQARAALDAAASLRLGEPVREDIWFDLDYPGAVSERVAQIAKDMAQMDLGLQRSFFTLVLNHYLSIMPGHPGVHLNWYQGNDQPALVVTSGLGFVRAAWLNIAQVIAGVRSLLICNGCGEPYARQGRSPKKGGRNFCPDCGPGSDYSASKRIHWQSSHNVKSPRNRR